MAQRRMFSKKITDTDKFLDMPMSAQCLYFHLNMEADDEGFLGNARTVQRKVGASSDDLKLLIAKSFIIPFESGVVVIKDWRVHNYIQNDRFTPTMYKEEKMLLHQRFEDGKGQNLVNVYKMDTQVRLGKDSIDKDNNINNGQSEVNNPMSDFEKLWSLYPKKQKKDIAYKAYLKAIKSGTTNVDIQTGIMNYRKHIEIKKIENEYIQQGGHWFNQKRWEDEYDMTPRSNNNYKNTIKSIEMTETEKQALHDKDVPVDDETIKKLRGRLG